MIEVAAAPPASKGHHRLAVTAAVALFAGWIGFLLWQTLFYANGVVVSRPQLLSAPIVAQGKLLIDPPRLEVRKILWESPKAKAPSIGDVINVLNLSIDPHLDREGEYVVPLEWAGGQYLIWEIPRDPKLLPPARSARYYPARPDVATQVTRLLESRRGADSVGATTDD